jgi:hypothetical protein
MYLEHISIIDLLACVGQTFGMARAGDSAVRRCSSIDHVLLFCWGVLQKLGHGGFEGSGLDPRMGSVNLWLRQLRFQFGAQLGGTILGLLKAGGVIQDHQHQRRLSRQRPQANTI